MLASKDRILRAISLLLLRLKVGINIMLGVNNTWSAAYLESSGGRRRSQSEALCSTDRQCKEKKNN